MIRDKRRLTGRRASLRPSPRVTAKPKATCQGEVRSTKPEAGSPFPLPLPLPRPLPILAPARLRARFRGAHPVRAAPPHRESKGSYSRLSRRSRRRLVTAKCEARSLKPDLRSRFRARFQWRARRPDTPARSHHHAAKTPRQAPNDARRFEGRRKARSPRRVQERLRRQASLPSSRAERADRDVLPLRHDHQQRRPPTYDHRTMPPLAPAQRVLEPHPVQRIDDLPAGK